MDVEQDHSIVSTKYDQVITGFCERTIDKSLWTHEAHLIMAIWFCMRYDPLDALCRIKSGIISYNLAVGGENTGTNGYHETITIFWWRWINLYIASHFTRDFEKMCDGFLGSKYNRKDAPFDFYSKEKLFSREARAMYIDPDLKKVELEQ